jgi:hypothetical protein
VPYGAPVSGNIRKATRPITNPTDETSRYKAASERGPAL